MIALAYSVPTGVLAGWSGVLDMILTPVRVSQVRNHISSLNKIGCKTVGFFVVLLCLFNVHFDWLCKAL